MDLKTPDAPTLRQYLLGSLPSEAQQSVEEWLLTDDEAVDLLEAAEDDLVDDAVAGNLNDADTQRFQDHFLRAPEHRTKLDFSKPFLQFVRQETRRPEPRSREGLSFRESLAQLFRVWPSPAYTSLAAFVMVVGVAIAGLSWSVLLRSQLQTNSAALDLLRGTSEQTAQSLKKSETVRTQYETQLRELELLLDQSASPSRAVGILSVVLNPGLTRSAGGVRAVTVPQTARILQFRLPLLSNDFREYRAVLLDEGGQPLVSRVGLVPVQSEGAAVVIFTALPQLFRSGDYTIELEGSADGRTQTVGQYTVRLTRQ